jgi:flagellar motor component MotA
MLKKDEQKNETSVKNTKEIDQDLFLQLEQFREDTKSLDYLRDEMKNAYKGKSDEEIVKSLAQVLAQDKKRRSS